MFVLVPIVVFICCLSGFQQQENFDVHLKMKNEFSGWVFVIESEGKQKASPESNSFLVDSGVVFIPRLLNDSVPVVFKLMDAQNNDVSQNVKLFFRSEHSVSNRQGKPIRYFVFYYPTRNELTLGADRWLDVDFTEKYTNEAVRIRLELERRGVFDK